LLESCIADGHYSYDDILMPKGAAHLLLRVSSAPLTVAVLAGQLWLYSQLNFQNIDL
jgi:hypothetical protein